MGTHEHGDAEMGELQRAPACVSTAGARGKLASVLRRAQCKLAAALQRKTGGLRVFAAQKGAPSADHVPASALPITRLDERTLMTCLCAIKLTPDRTHPESTTAQFSAAVIGSLRRSCHRLRNVDLPAYLPSVLRNSLDAAGCGRLLLDYYCGPDVRWPLQLLPVVTAVAGVECQGRPTHTPNWLNSPTKYSSPLWCASLEK